MSLEEAAARLVDFSQPFDTPLLEQILSVAFNPRDPNSRVANHVVIQLQQHENMWQAVTTIIENGTTLASKVFAAQVLHQTIQSKWKAMPAEHRQGVKTYVINAITALCQTENISADQRTFLNKMNLVLVDIVKKEWPEDWPDFIPQIVELSRQNEAICENNMHILRLLSEEVFDFGMDQTTQKNKVLKEAFKGQFAQVFELCNFIMEASQVPSLLVMTLKTLGAFLTWMDSRYIFESQLVPRIVNTYLVQPTFRNAALECITEVSGLKVEGVEYDAIFQGLYNAVMQQLMVMLPPEVNIPEAFETAGDDDELFVRNLSLFFTTFFTHHLARLERGSGMRELILRGFTYLLSISEVDDEEIFKICQDYYHHFSESLYRSSLQGGIRMPSGATRGGSRRDLYRDIMQRLQTVVIGRMAKPEEVLIVEDEDGSIVREKTKDTAVIAQYQQQSETLVFLTHLDYERTQDIMLDKLAKQVDCSEWSWHALNTLCWAIGSISGAMNEEEEKRFLVTVIKDLLSLCEIKRGKDNKAVIASNIMYVVGQYPRFLNAHWKFLKTVVNKLFEFMHEKHPGVQDMACDTFLKIAQKCKRKFLQLQTGETRPYIEALAEDLPVTICDLEPHQVNTFYEAVGTVLSDRGSRTTGVNRPEVLAQVCAPLNRQFMEIRAQGAQNPNFLCDVLTAEALQRIYRSNASICSAAGSIYIYQLSNFYMDSINVFGLYTERINAEVAASGEIAVRHTQCKALRNARREFIRLITTFINASGEPESGPGVLLEIVLPPMLGPVLECYSKSAPAARDSEVLLLCTSLVDKLAAHITGEMPKIIAAIFEGTLDLLTKNFEDHPDLRVRFYKFLRAVNKNCFGALAALPDSQAKLVIDAILWAMKHTDRNISEMGLETLQELLSNVRTAPQMSQAFYQGYLLLLVQEVLAVLTDRLHKSDFRLHAALLRQLFHIVELGQVQVPLFDTAANPNMDNSKYVREHTAALLLRAFPNLRPPQVQQFMAGLFDINKSQEAFKNLLRDFLVELTEFSAEDNQELYTEERELQKQQAAEADRQRRLAVPGLMKPGEVDDDDL
mmetsp:Transcript_14742/g.44368  ORF Transcript_14742/g.44368 Transcript_14742/m.44368 type:complete len:1072 (-) Transcript_14742:108-3323(-)